MRTLSVIVGTLLLSGSILVGPSPAAIVANFTEGNGDTLPDQFPGAFGDGWLGGWQTDDVGSVASVVDTNPLGGGGNYLSLNASTAEGTGIRNRWVRRPVGDFDDVFLDQPHTISFDFRPETPLSGDTVNNRFHIFGATAAGDNTSADASWIAMASSGVTAGDTPIDLVVGNWGFLSGTDGTTVNFAGTTFVDTGIAMEAGTVYHFEIELDPANRRYKPSLSDGVNSFTASDFLPYRNQGDGASPVVAPWLHFAKRFSDENEGAEVGFSLDNLSVEVPSTAVPGDFDGDGDVDGADFVIWQTNFPFTPAAGAAAVPEPAAWMLALLAAGGFAVARRIP